jgi:hypothetical protein
MKANAKILCKDSKNHLLYFENNQELTTITNRLLDAVVQSDITKMHVEFTGKSLVLPIEITITITEPND